MAPSRRASSTPGQVVLRGFEPEVRDLFCSRDAPRRKLTVAADLLNGPAGLVPAMGDLSLTSSRLDLAADRAARLGSWEVRAMQQGWGCFNPTRPIELTEWCYEQFDRHDVEARVREALLRTAERIVFPDQIVAVVIPADPANLNLMVHGGGLSVASTAEGRVALQIWPDGGNLQRLEAALARALRIGAAWRQAPAIRLGELLELDGEVTRAQVVAGEIPVAWSEAPWSLTVAPPPGHAATLQAIAEASGVPSYDDLHTNVYGQDVVATDQSQSVEDELSKLLPHPLPTDQLDAADQWLSDTGLLESSDPRDAAAVCFGDDAVERVGHPAHGFAPWAGLQLAAQHSDRAAR